MIYYYLGSDTILVIVPKCTTTTITVDVKWSKDLSEVQNFSFNSIGLTQKKNWSSLWITATLTESLCFYRLKSNSFFLPNLKFGHLSFSLFFPPAQRWSPSLALIPELIWTATKCKNLEWTQLFYLLNFCNNLYMKLFIGWLSNNFWVCESGGAMQKWL